MIFLKFELILEKKLFDHDNPPLFPSSLELLTRFFQTVFFDTIPTHHVATSTGMIYFKFLQNLLYRLLFNMNYAHSQFPTFTIFKKFKNIKK